MSIFNFTRGAKAKARREEKSAAVKSQLRGATRVLSAAAARAAQLAAVEITASDVEVVAEPEESGVSREIRGGLFEQELGGK